MSNTFETISPIDNSVYVQRNYTNDRIENTIEKSRIAQLDWANLGTQERIKLLKNFVDDFLSREKEIIEEITWQIGRPINQVPGELKGFKERADYMLSIAEFKLNHLKIKENANFKNYIKRVPLGVVFVIAPWNYPYLTSVNSIIPALASGNTVILKHSAQTPICAEQLYKSAKNILPEGVFSYLHINHEDGLRVIADKRINFVSFTGSVKAGYEVNSASKNKFINVGLELGGKDPAYVRKDALLESTVDNLVDGSFFNSGQSCCGIERIYVDKDIYQKFLELFISTTYKYKLGNPLDEKTTIGPVVKKSSAEFIVSQIENAVKDGAKKMIDESQFQNDMKFSNYLVPQVLTNVDHNMNFMKEETFGPAIGIMPVDNEKQAVSLMNDSPYGLTASIWTQDIKLAELVGNQIDTGTFFMNRCDYLDPGLAWTGVKETGKGCSLSEISYENFTRPKSFHLRIKV